MVLIKKPVLGPTLNNLRAIRISGPIRKLFEALALPELKQLIDNPSVTGSC
jgi:hypothetical protein